MIGVYEPIVIAANGFERLSSRLVEGLLTPGAVPTHASCSAGLRHVVA